MKSPNKPDVLEERLTSLFERGFWSYQIPPDYTIVEQAKQEILNWHKSQVKELVGEIIGEDEKFKNLYQWHEVQPLNLLRAEQRTKAKALIDKLGEE